MLIVRGFTVLQIKHSYISYRDIGKKVRSNDRQGRPLKSRADPALSFVCVCVGGTIDDIPANSSCVSIEVGCVFLAMLV